MRKIAVVLLIVACVGVHCDDDNDSWVNIAWNEASVRLYNMWRNKAVGAINLSQSIVESPKRTTDVLGRLWGVRARTYFAVISKNLNATCHQPGEILQTYDDNIKGMRPLTLFVNEIADVNRREFSYIATNVSLNPEEMNSIMNHIVVVCPADWDSAGPLDSYFQLKNPVACGVVAPGLMERHVFQVPQGPNPE